MGNESKYYGKYMDNESYCEGQKPFIHMHLDNIIRDVLSVYGLSTISDYTIEFTESAVTVSFSISTDKSDDVTNFISTIKDRIVLLASERYPILYEQPEANRIHNFYVGFSDILNSAKPEYTDNTYKLSMTCNY